jgi:Ca2+/H+ antiporter, TMEM165/GDT1 family
MIQWAHAGPPMLAAFLASLVEFVEALTIVLAVGTVRGWRPALIGTAGGVGLLAVLVAVFGPALKQVPIHYLQVVVGVLLLLFGMRWLRKAILRSADILGLHDEDAAYEKQTKALSADGAVARDRLDMVAVATTFKAVTLEGLEVVFIVIATGAVGHMLIPASLAAAAAGVVVISLGVMLHKPLARVPENTLKFAVGLILSAFGVFWLGEGFGFPWPGEDWSVVALFGGFLIAALAAVALARQAAARPLVGTGNLS